MKITTTTIPWYIYLKTIPNVTFRKPRRKSSWTINVIQPFWQILFVGPRRRNTEEEIQRYYFWSSFFQELEIPSTTGPAWLNIMLMKSSQTLRTDHLLVSSRTVLCSIFAAATIFRRTFSRCPFSDSPNSRRSSLTVKRIFSSRLKIFIHEEYRK